VTITFKAKCSKKNTNVQAFKEITGNRYGASEGFRFESPSLLSDSHFFISYFCEKTVYALLFCGIAICTSEHGCRKLNQHSDDISDDLLLRCIRQMNRLVIFPRRSGTSSVSGGVGPSGQTVVE